MKKMLLITSLTRNVIQRFTDTTYLLRHALNIYIFRLKSMTFCDLMELRCWNFRRHLATNLDLIIWCPHLRQQEQTSQFLLTNPVTHHIADKVIDWLWAVPMLPGLASGLPVWGGDVDSTSLIVQRVLWMVAVLVPALGHPQLHTGPHVHHRDGQGVQLVFTTLEKEREGDTGREREGRLLETNNMMSSEKDVLREKRDVLMSLRHDWLWARYSQRP